MAAPAHAIVPMPLVGLVRDIIASVVLRCFPRGYARGLRVVFVNIDADRALCLSRLQEAIDMVASAGSSFQANLRRVRHVAVWMACNASIDSLGGVQLASEDIIDLPTILLASVLVHEATHLRVAARHIKYEGSLRARIEELCVREQARFLRTFGGTGEKLAGVVEESLKQRWWEDSALEAELQRQLVQHQVPPWLEALIRASRDAN